MANFLIHNDEHRMLHETAMHVFSRPVDLSNALADSGLLALSFAAVDGGLRQENTGDYTDLAIAFAAKGQAFAIESILFQAVLGGDIIASSHAENRTAIIQGIISGAEQIATGLYEFGARCDPYHCGTKASRTAEGWQIDGAKTFVIGADTASRLLILARIEDCPENRRAGLGLFFLDPTTPGVQRRSYHLRDGCSAADINLSGVQLNNSALIHEGSATTEAVDRALTTARLCLAAEASGLMRSILAKTAAYVNQREQFGKAIGSFQVIQHKLADMVILADQSEALVSQAAQQSDDFVAINGTHRSVSELGLAAAKSAIQMHGGYGMTEDLALGLAMRRMMTISLLF